jgi:hypothetical protein
VSAPLSGLLPPELDVAGVVWLNKAKLAQAAREGGLVAEPLTQPFIDSVQAMSEENYRSWLSDLEAEGMSEAAIAHALPQGEVGNQ